MKLTELLTEAVGTAGYWTFEERGGVRHWTPVMSSSVGEGGMFPFATIQNAPRGDTAVKGFQAFDILPGRTRQDLTKEERPLFAGLENALKLRSETDVISPGDYATLVNAAVVQLVMKSQLRKQKPNRIFITAPASSSNVADEFAKSIQMKLKVPAEQMFLGHFTKRDVVDIIDDIEAKVPEGADRDGVLDRIWRNYEARPDSTFKIKDLWNGHRKVLMKAGIDIFDVVRSVDLNTAVVPYLLIVDDNVQSGSTAQMLARSFVQHTGVSPANVLSLAMFKYP